MTGGIRAAGHVSIIYVFKKKDYSGHNVENTLEEGKHESRTAAVVPTRDDRYSLALEWWRR